MCIEVIQQDCNHPLPGIYSSNAKQEYDSCKTFGGDILLTGASGFIGKRHLRELLKITESDGKTKIYCLVRDSERSNSFAQQWSNNDRVVVLKSDLLAESFGLTNEVYSMLCDTVSQIFHHACVVNWRASYEALRPVNVQTLVNLLKFASTGLLKHFHFNSTLRVYGLRIDLYYEEDMEVLDKIDVANFGSPYFQQKYVCEKILFRAFSERGMPFTTYRSGIVGFDTETGEGNYTDYFCRMIGSCVRTGVAPSSCFSNRKTSQKDPKDIITLLPVNTHASLVVRIALKIHQMKQQANVTSKINRMAFNVWNPNIGLGIDLLIDAIKSFGVPLQVLEYDEWYLVMKHRMQQIKEPRENSFVPLLNFSTDSLVPSFPYSFISDVIQNTTNLQTFVKMIDADLVPYSKESILKHLRALQKKGYIMNKSSL